MYLKRVEISGFKSFAQKTVLKFDKGIAAIVGPNGSGKSNIADAIRWAMGEQSPKLIRIKKSEDVIFVGSGKKSQQGAASVFLYLDNSKGRIPIDFSEVAITRRIYRSGENEYLINKRKVRLSDVIDLLAASGVSQKGYSVINQGMADNILSSSPQEKKDMFDQATGVKQYQIKAQQTFRRLEATERNLTRVSDLLNEIAPRLRSLKRQANKAEQRGETEKNLRELQEKWFSFSILKLRHSQKKLKEQRQELNKEIFTIQKKADSIRKKIKTTGILNQNRAETEKRLSEKLSDIQSKRNELQKKLAIIEGRIELEREKESNFSEIIPMDVSFIKKELKEIFEIYKIMQKDWNNAKKNNDFSNFGKYFENLGKRLEQILNQMKTGKISSLMPKEKIKLAILKFQEDKKNLEMKLQKFEKIILKVKDDIRKDFEKNQEENKEFFVFQGELRKILEETNKKKDERREIEIEEARVETRLEDIAREIDENLENFEVMELKEQIDEIEIKSQIERLKIRLAQIGGIDSDVLDEYKEAEERHNFLTNQLEDLKKAEKSLIKTISCLEKKIENQFSESFKNINEEFNRYFRLIFGGGKAELKIQDYSKIKTEEEENNNSGNSDSVQNSKSINLQVLNKFSNKGIEIKVSLPDKKIKGVAMLSGGERALVSIAVLFAIIKNNPPPFSVLDEIDAALDEANSERIGKILKELSYATQFILITHNRQIMREASVLYGVTIGEDGVSKLVSVKLDKE